MVFVLFFYILNVTRVILVAHGGMGRGITKQWCMTVFLFLLLLLSFKSQAQIVACVIQCTAHKIIHVNVCRFSCTINLQSVLDLPNYVWSHIWYVCAMSGQVQWTWAKSVLFLSERCKSLIRNFTHYGATCVLSFMMGCPSRSCNAHFLNECCSHRT